MLTIPLFVFGELDVRVNWQTNSVTADNGLADNTNLWFPAWYDNCLDMIFDGL